MRTSCLKASIIGRKRLWMSRNNAETRSAKEWCQRLVAGRDSSSVSRAAANEIVLQLSCPHRGGRLSFPISLQFHKLMPFPECFG